MEYDDENEKKQAFLQEEIIDQNYDKTRFINFCISKKEIGDDLNNWSFEEFQNIVFEFIIKENEKIVEENEKYKDYKKSKENENENLNIPTNTVRIFFPRTYYLSRNNIYLILFWKFSKNIKTRSLAI